MRLRREGGAGGGAGGEWGGVDGVDVAVSGGDVYDELG